MIAERMKYDQKKKLKNNLEEIIEAQRAVQKCVIIKFEWRKKQNSYYLISEYT